jgi:hypothetical protein
MCAEYEPTRPSCRCETSARAELVREPMHKLRLRAKLKDPVSYFEVPLPASIVNQLNAGLKIEERDNEPIEEGNGANGLPSLLLRLLSNWRSREKRSDASCEFWLFGFRLSSQWRENEMAAQIVVNGVWCDASPRDDATRQVKANASMAELDHLGRRFNFGAGGVVGSTRRKPAALDQLFSCCRGFDDVAKPAQSNRPADFRGCVNEENCKGSGDSGRSLGR